MRALLLPLLLPLHTALAQLPAAPEPTPELAPIAPPVDVFPYPPWMVISAGTAAALLVALFLWWLMKWAGRRATPPLPPREATLRALQALRPHASTTEPYPFSIEVCDLLRRYVTQQYHIHATEQTSPEFLSAVSAAAQFGEEEKALLATFLEKADLIKFARLAATSTDSEQLVEQALRFVKGKEVAA